MNVWKCFVFDLEIPGIVVNSLELHGIHFVVWTITWINGLIWGSIFILSAAKALKIVYFIVSAGSRVSFFPKLFFDHPKKNFFPVLWDVANGDRKCTQILFTLPKISTFCLMQISCCYSCNNF